MIINPYQFGTPAGGDPYYANVSSLLNMNEADGTTFTDAKAGITWDAIGNAQIISNWYVGDGSGDYLVLSSGSSSVFQMGTGDFTIEGFLQTTSNDIVMTDMRATGFEGIVVFLQGATGFPGAFNNGGPGSDTSVVGNVNAADNAVHHYAFSRVSGTMYVCLDGSVIGSGSMPNDMNDAGFCFHGATNSGTLSFNGKLRGLRITKGVGRYSGSFTPPTWPLPTF